MNKQALIVGSVILVVILAGYFLLTGQQSQSSLSTPPTVTETVSPTLESTGSSEESGQTKEFIILGSNYKFSLDKISVKKGDKVKVTFKNSGGLHNFVIDEFNVKTKIIDAGQEESVEFIATKVGQFEYYCSVANHRQLGMKGMLTVE